MIDRRTVKPKKDRKGAVRSLVAALTPKQARKEIRAEAKLAYGDKLRDYGKQIGASQQQSRQINQWYGQYRDDVAKLQGDQRGATNRLGEYARSWDSDAATRSGAEASRVGGEEDRSAAIRGAVADAGAGATESAAEQQRKNLRQSYADQTYRTGVANENMLGELRNASFSGLRDDQRRERNARMNLMKDRNATKKERDLFKVSQMAVKRKEERDWRFQNKSLRSDNANAAADRALDRARENRIASEGSGSGGSGGSGGGGGGVSPKDVRKASAYLREGLRETGATWGNWRELRANKTVLVDDLINRGVDPAVARAAYRTLLGRWRNQRGGKPSNPSRGDYR